MKLRYEDLEQHLKKKLAPIYWLSGDEPWLMNDAKNKIRLAAHSVGFQERHILEPEPNWGNIYSELQNLSLFNPKKLIEIHLNQIKVNDAASTLLQNYLAKPNSDIILVICSPKLEAKASQSNWYKAITQAGITVAIWPINPEQTSHWIRQYLAQHNMQATPQAIAYLAELLEGNLSAIAQEIEKLKILYPNKCLAQTDIAACINEQMQFNLFSLTESALQGKGQRVIKIFNYLHREGIEPSLILWAFTQELRLLAGIAHQTTQGSTIIQSLQHLKIIDKKKVLLQKALTRKLNWDRLLQNAAYIDRMIKGIEKGNAWQALLKLSLNLAGYSILQAREIVI